MKFQHLLFSSLFLGVAVIAYSQNPQARQQPTTEQRVQNWLRQMDSDQDGSIAKEESRGLMQRNFQNIDQNKDGILDRKELVALGNRLAQNANRAPNRNANQQQRGDAVPSDDAVRKQAPDGLILDLNIVYREGHERWMLDLAMPAQKSDEPRPAIVFIHGGGWRNGDKRRGAFLGLALHFASKGYVTITTNYRLGSEKLHCIEDVKCAVRWLRAHADKYNVDPDRIGAYGNSAGAHLVTMLGISYTEKKLEGDGPWQDYSSRVQAVAASATPTTPRLTADVDYPPKLIQPMNYITADAPPFLLFHEISDSTVAVSNSDDFVKAMKEAGAKDITYHRWEDGTGHGVYGRNKEKTWPMTEAFFLRTLSP